MKICEDNGVSWTFLHLTKMFTKDIMVGLQHSASCLRAFKVVLSIHLAHTTVPSRCIYIILEACAQLGEGCQYML